MLNKILKFFKKDKIKMDSIKKNQTFLMMKHYILMNYI